MKRIFLFLISVFVFSYSYTLKEFLLEYCSKHKLHLIYNVKLNPQIYPYSFKNLNYLDLQKYFNISFIRDKDYLIVTKPIKRTYVFFVYQDQDNLKQIFSFLKSNNIQYSYINRNLSFVTTPYIFYNIVNPFISKFSSKPFLRSSRLTSRPAEDETARTRARTEEVIVE